MSAGTLTLRAAPALALSALLLACAGRSAPAQVEARAVFDRFRTALRQGDRESLRDLLTSDSGPAIDALVETRVESSASLLAAVAATEMRGSGSVEIELEQPDGERGVFVVVREDGRWRVDLVESAARTHGIQKGAGFDVHRGADPADVQDAVMRGRDGIR